MAKPFFLIILFFFFLSSGDSIPFRCTSTGASCSSIIDYISPNATTLSSIQSLFSITDPGSLLAVNNLPPSTPTTSPVAANQTVRIRFPCTCSNNTGVSHNTPIYTVVPGDGLYHIAAEVFAGLVTYQEIQAANNIPDANLIMVGRRLWIPLPCSCDEVEGERVVHYGHVVEEGGSLVGIGEEFNVSVSTLMGVNGLSSGVELVAGAVLDVPLRGMYYVCI